MNVIMMLAVFLPMFGGIVSYLTGRKSKNARDYVVWAFAVAELIFAGVLTGSVLAGGEACASVTEFCGMGLQFKLDGFRALYVLIASFMWLATSIFSKEYLKEERNRNRYYLFWLVTLGAVAGVLLSADLYTTFIFFELMSFTSFVWVIQEEKKEGIHAGNLYLGIAVISGLVMLMGLMMLYDEIGTVTMSEIPVMIAAKKISAGVAGKAAALETRLFISGCLMLVGFGAKAGLFLLHVWLPKAHTVAPAPASAILSGVLTKMGIFGILVLTGTMFRGNETWGMLLLVLGILTMFTGAFLALFSVNFKRTLACSSVSQMGFILVGISMFTLLESNTLAMNGTLLHMVNHSLIKLVLFLTAGVIMMKTESLDLNEIRGYGRNKPLLHLAFGIGAFSIAGIPLGSGYVSKTLLHESLVEYLEEIVGSAGYDFVKAMEIMFLVTGGMTLAYMLKLYFAVFIEKGKAEEEPSCKPLTLVTVLIPALILLVFGLLPNLFMDRIAEFGVLTEAAATGAHHGTVHYFTWTNLKGAVISISIGLLLYFGVIRTLLMKKEGNKKVYVNRLPEWFDLEKSVYQPVVLKFLPFVCAFVCRVCDKLVDGIVFLLRKKVFGPKKKHRPVAVGTGFTYAVGTFLDGIVVVLNCTFRRKRPIETSFVNELAIRREEMGATYSLVARGVSFGLLLFCIGLLLTLIYVLF
ncbi:MAG: complex I subunit 5 family protein [Lachnospiraceae bacterium]